jgi:hypothetical protein
MAKRVRQALKGSGTDDVMLIRIIAGTACRCAVRDVATPSADDSARAQARRVPIRSCASSLRTLRTTSTRCAPLGSAPRLTDCRPARRAGKAISSTRPPCRTCRTSRLRTKRSSVRLRAVLRAWFSPTPPRSPSAAPRRADTKLVDDVASDTTGNYRRLLLTLLQPPEETIAGALGARGRGGHARSCSTDTDATRLVQRGAGGQGHRR